MNLVSPWRITYDPIGSAPLVLVDFLQELTGSLEFPWSQKVQGSERTEALYLRYFGRGNAETGLQISVFKNHGTLYDALAYGPDHNQAIAALDGKDVKVELQNGRRWRVSRCVIRDTKPKWMPEEGVAVTLTTYNILGSGWGGIPCAWYSEPCSALTTPCAQL